VKYASEVISLLAAHPDREFRMGEIVRYIDPHPTAQVRHKIRIGVHRVMIELERAGALRVDRPSQQPGSGARYRWQSDTRSACDVSREA
jgi:hypothetical protein